MSKTALLFAGQGAQTVGMGKDLAEKFPEARSWFDRANAALQPAVQQREHHRRGWRLRPRARDAGGKAIDEAIDVTR